MSKLLLIFSWVILVEAKLDVIPLQLRIERYDKVVPKHGEDLAVQEETKVSEEISKDLWVLKLDDLLQSLKFRPGSRSEEEEFDAAFGYLMKGFDRHQTARVKKDDPNRNKHSNSNQQNNDNNEKSASEKTNEKSNELQIKGEIMRIINKFALSVHADIDPYLFETQDEGSYPTLSFYFKGPFTSLTVKCGRKRSNYFIGPPSPLPNWFYEDHSKSNTKAMYLDVPKDVEKQFYQTLLHMLQMFLSFPV